MSALMALCRAEHHLLKQTTVRDPSRAGLCIRPSGLRQPYLQLLHVLDWNPLLQEVHGRGDAEGVRQELGREACPLVRGVAAEFHTSASLWARM